jgi:transposase-like protein
MQKISYDGYRFPPEIIRQAIWLYLRFTLSLRLKSRETHRTLRSGAMSVWREATAAA